MAEITGNISPKDRRRIAGIIGRMCADQVRFIGYLFPGIFTNCCRVGRNGTQRNATERNGTQRDATGRNGMGRIDVNG